jgi:HK97 family phage portal protein
MAIVQSFGALAAMTGAVPTWAPASGGSLDIYGARMAYATLYATQPNVRTMVDFLSRNIAQLGLHAFRRVSDTDRERLIDHDIVRWLGQPNPATTRYRLIESLMGDLGIYFDAFWAKVRGTAPDGRRSLGLVRLPPDQMTVEGALLPTHYCWTVNGVKTEFPLTEIVHFGGYNPRDPKRGLSNLETLRRILAEEAAAGDHRQSYWANAGRMEGIIEQAINGPKFGEPQQRDFRADWQEFSGNGARVGQVAVLPKGMTYKQASFSAKDSEYLSARKLTREECAAAYHIPLPLVGILEHATFSNIKEQHKHLYQDCLGPWLEMIVQEIERQVLVECDDRADIYLEFNIAAKLAGSFEEQAASLQMAVGKPWMTVNEGRAKQNLPSHPNPEADEIAAQQGGPAGVRPAFTGAAVERVVRATWSRQAVRLAKRPVAERAEALNHARCCTELAADLRPILGADAAEYAARVTDDTYVLLLEGADAFSADREIRPL